MKMKKLFVFGILLILAFAFFVSADASRSNPQLTQPGSLSSSYNFGVGADSSSLADRNKCEKGKDFILQVAPFGCEPALVRSDLLEEQNVPVFCKIAATQVNPLIDIEAISSMDFKGAVPEGVSGVGFHPANAAIKGGKTLLNSPVLENIGYAVIVLKKQKNESNMPDEISGTLTARIKYDLKNVFGVGKASYYLPELSDEEWGQRYGAYGFWREKGYLRADSVEENSATISVYNQNGQNVLQTLNLEKGQTSAQIDLPGFYCLAGMQLRLDGLENPNTRAKLNINGDIVEVIDGETFLENRCIARNPEKSGLVQKVTLDCKGDTGREIFDLKISPKIIIQIDGVNQTVGIGDKIFTYLDNKKAVYVGYIGTKRGTEKIQDLYLWFMAKPEQTLKLTSSDLKEMSLVNNLMSEANLNVGLFSVTADLAKIGFAGLKQIYAYIKEGKVYGTVAYNNELEFDGRKIKIIGFVDPVDKPFLDNQDEIESEVDKMFNYLEIKPLPDTDTKKLRNNLEEVLSFLYQEFGEQIHKDKMVLEVVRDSELELYFGGMVQREDNIKRLSEIIPILKDVRDVIPAVDRILSINIPGEDRIIKIAESEINNPKTINHELFHSMYQSPNFLNNYPNFVIEGLARYAEWKYEYPDKTNEEIAILISNKLNELAPDFQGLTSIDPNKNFNVYDSKDRWILYEVAAHYFFLQNLDRAKLREILEKGGSLTKKQTFEEFRNAHGFSEFVDPTKGFSITGNVVDEYVANEDVIIEQIASLKNSRATKNNYDSAIRDFKEIISSYPNVKDGEHLVEGTEISFDKIEQETFGEQAFFDAIQLAYRLEQKRTMMLLCNEFKDAFPNSNTTIPECESDYKASNQEFSSYDVLINNLARSISFEGIYEPSFEEFSAVVKVRDSNGDISTYSLRKNLPVLINDLTEESIELIDLTSQTATIRMNIFPIDIEGKLSNLIESRSGTLSMNNAVGKGGYSFTLVEVNLKRQAKVSILPRVDNAGTETNFSFNIGIEKRAIQLSPDQIENRIEDLENMINNWGKISDDLGTVVKGFNAACLATGTMLTVKNFFDNTEGKSISRQKVMRSEGGWMDLCGEKVGVGEFSSVNDCLLNNSEKIDKDVEFFYNAMKGAGINEENADVQIALVGESLNSTIKDPRGFGENIDTTYVKELFKFKGENRTISYTDARDLNAIDSALKEDLSDEMKRALEIERYKIIAELTIDAEDLSAKKSLEEELGSIEGLTSTGSVGVYGRKDSIDGVYDGRIVTKEGFGEIESFAPVQFIIYNGKKYLLELTKVSANEYTVEDVYTLKGNKLSGEESIKEFDATRYDKNVQEIKERFNIFKEYDVGTYKNRFKEAEVKYFETEPYKGRPALVPFDLNNGWYAAMKQTLPHFGDLATYDESGAVSSFYLCNVGKNGRAEFNSATRDDECQGFNPGTGVLVKEFPYLEPSEVNRLVNSAIRAVQDAQNQYKAGITSVMIGRERISVGSPEVGAPETQCQDFMSPKDCHLLFNVCDPVVCPTSRCNLGGTYYSSNVIQSGIIGSIALCLPNMKENIFVPICLTGLKAGIDNLLSVFTNYRDCLETQLESGETVGICDEIHSIYLCEFFWREALPFAKTIVPRIFESFLGQDGTRGGGEYLGVQTAWQNAQDSLDYVSQYYGRDVTNAFKVKLTEEVGGAVCKNFISANYPAGGEVLDSLIEPASPPQYHAYFNEITFTTATVPPTSHYKVYYHIFAGEESKAFYRVYLKNPAGTSLYQTNPVLDVASGFASKGSYASETKDFTAPTGYKELCIDVNGQENCGFKQVTTNFAVDYVEDLYLKEQAGKTDINSEADCISGTPSLYSFAQPNLQEGLSETVSPSIYNRGIIRVCGTENPGKGTDININTNDARWKNVGTCDGERGNLKCWIDTQSVKDVIETTTIEEEVLGEVSNNYVDTLLAEGDYIDFAKELISINNLSDADKVKYITEDLISRAFFNDQKAKLYFIRANAYGVLANNFFNKIKIIRLQKKIAQDEELPGFEEDGFEELPGFEEETPTSIDKISCSNEMYSGQCEVGKRIIQIAIDYQESNDITFDKETFYNDLGINCFEQLVLQLAMQESLISHCKNEIHKGKDFENDFNCDNSEEDVLIGSDGVSTGVMQINVDKHPSVNAINFDNNVKYGLDLLTENFFKGKSTWKCESDSKDYDGWKSALRRYNGLNCGDADYVENVLEKSFNVREIFGDVCTKIEFTEVEDTRDTLNVVNENVGLNVGDVKYPIFEFQDGKLSENLFYTYSDSKGWFWSEDRDDYNSDDWKSVNDVEGLDVEDASFVKNLQDKNYENGLLWLIGEITNLEGGFFGGNDLVTDNIIFSQDKTFTLDKRDNNGNVIYRIYFKRGNANWGYSFDRKDWRDVKNILKDDLFKDYPSEVINLINNLNEKSFEEGAISIFAFDVGTISGLESFSSGDVEKIKDAKSCEDCGKGRTNFCGSEECLAISREINIPCQYNFLDRFKPCVTKKDIELPTREAQETGIYFYPIFEMHERGLNSFYFYNKDKGWLWSAEKHSYDSSNWVEVGQGMNLQESILFLDEDKALLDNLIGKNYMQGLNLLIEEIKIRRSSQIWRFVELSTENVLFEPDGTFNVNDNYKIRLNFLENRWKYQIFSSDWKNVEDVLEDYVSSVYLTKKGISLIGNLANKNFEEGAVFIFSWDSEYLEDSEIKINSIVASYKLNSKEKEVISNAKDCDHCGDGRFNFCDENECLAINEILGGGKCEWKISTIPFYDCFPVIRVEETENIQDYVVFEFNDGVVSVSDLLYRYVDGKWQWAYTDNFDNWYDSSITNFQTFDGREISLTDKNKDFMKKMVTASYKEGVEALIERVIANEEEGVLDPSLSSDKIVFDVDSTLKVSTLPDERIFDKKSLVYLKFDNNQWFISVDKFKWISVEDSKGLLTERGDNLMGSLKTKGKYEGIIFIFEF